MIIFNCLNSHSVLIFRLISSECVYKRARLLKMHVNLVVHQLNESVFIVEKSACKLVYGIKSTMLGKLTSTSSVKKKFCHFLKDLMLKSVLLVV
jgi:hypothetical protein